MPPTECPEWKWDVVLLFFVRFSPKPGQFWVVRTNKERIYVCDPFFFVWIVLWHSKENVRFVSVEATISNSNNHCGAYSKDGFHSSPEWLGKTIQWVPSRGNSGQYSWHPCLGNMVFSLMETPLQWQDDQPDGLWSRYSRSSWYSAENHVFSNTSCSERQAAFLYPPCYCYSCTC